MTRLLLAALSAVVLAGPAAAQTWNQFQGNAQHTGAVAASAGAAITPLWSITPTAAGMTSFTPGAVTDGSRVYVAGRAAGNDPNGHANFRLAGLTAGSGAVAWGYTRGSYGGSVSAPSVGNGTVYAQFAGHDGISGGNPTQYPYLVGVSATAGTQQFATAFSSQFGNNRQPTLAGTQVLTMGGYFGGMYGHTAAGGQQWFTNDSAQPGSLPQQSQQVVAADATRAFVYMGSASFSPGPQQGTLFTVNRSTGAVTTAFTNAADNGTTYDFSGPVQNVVLGGRNDALFMATRSGGVGRQVVSVDVSAATATERWRADVALTGPMAVGGGRVFVPAGDRLRVLDQDTGAELWSWAAPAGESLTNNALLTNDLVFVSSAGNTYAVDLVTRQAVWTVADGGTLSWSDRTLLVSDANSLSVYFVPVPEPAGLLAAAAVGGLGWRRWRAARG